MEFVWPLSCPSAQGLHTKAHLLRQKTFSELIPNMTIGHKLSHNHTFFLPISPSLKQIMFVSQLVSFPRIWDCTVATSAVPNTCPKDQKNIPMISISWKPSITWQLADISEDRGGLRHSKRTMGDHLQHECGIWKNLCGSESFTGNFLKGRAGSFQCWPLEICLSTFLYSSFLLL